MGRFTGLVLPLVVLLAVASTPVFADHLDGMTLKLSNGPAPGSVALDWTGGQPAFSVYRSTAKTLIVDPSNLIGTTDVRTFADNPPPGAVFFYEIGSPCAYNPPEICNGLDDDCDGTVDGPGSESSCSLPHATATCTNGACAVAACTAGFGDCNLSPTDGCEAGLAAMQSTSPASIWANSANPDRDLVPGFQRVAAITNCGGCGITCDDGIPCTTDLCVAVQQARTLIGTCRHYDRGQCAEARCGGLPLAPGTPIPGDAACTAPDSDGDGLSDSWETQNQNPYDQSQQQVGIDLDCDGQITDSDGDFIYADPPAGPAVKDIYLQIAYMGPPVPPPPEETDGHAPLPGVVEAAVAAFQQHGMVLHVDPLMAEVPHASTVSLNGTGGECGAADGTTLAAIKGAVFDQRKRFTHRFALFAHDSCCTSNDSGTAQAGNSGLAEIKGNDIVVTLGEFQYAGPAAVQVDHKDREQSGTLLHELGHTLGLDHGGSSDLPCSPTPCDSSRTRKPNYISSMNYSYQLNGILRAATPGTTAPPDPDVPWRVDFSSGALASLDEGTLDEQQGLTGATPPYDRDIARYSCFGQGPFYAAGVGPIDWNCDQVFSPSVTSDIDDDQVLSTLNGAFDWDSLDFRFQCRPTFADGWTDPALMTRNELTHQFADARGLRAVSFPCQTDADCDDGDVCNGAETCQPATGVCQPGTPPSCDDTNPCTSDSCSTPANACVHVDATDGTPCDDGAWCTVGESCTAGVCGGASPRHCEDGLACTANACSEALQACVVAACTTAPCFSTPVGPGPAAGGPATDRAIVPAGAVSSTFVIKGSALYALRNAADAGGLVGTVRWTWNNPTGQTVNNFPNPVTLGTSGNEYLFLGATDGFVYKIRASDGVQVTQVDTRRSVCPTDQIFATPAVQLYNFSNAAWQADMDSHPGHAHDDVVFVITRNTCSDTTHNRVFAYYASDLSLKAVFNDTGTQLNAGNDACAVDYTNNRLYCGTDQSPLLPTQKSLWAFDSRTLALAWSERAGSILNRPTLKGGRLYVAARDGSIMAYDPAGSPTGTGQRLWTAAATVQPSVTRNPWVEFRPPAGFNSIFVVDGVGMLHRFTDQGSNATHDWALSPGAGLQFVTMPVLFPGVEKLYVGRNDGKLQQVDATSGAPMTPVQLNPPGEVYDPGLDLIPGAAFGWLTAASGNPVPGGVTGFCAPLP